MAVVLTIGVVLVGTAVGLIEAPPAVRLLAIAALANRSWSAAVVYRSTSRSYLHIIACKLHRYTHSSCSRFGFTGHLLIQLL